ncbi:FGFR1 oncogene partner 2 homolog [Amphiura filiformis]|uniref:FGFR1 oncogene partner 2 homolog n=1 Tax=Amphiura filiformis TaxID=82378 RepID=UPI003B21DD86
MKSDISSRGLPVIMSLSIEQVLADAKKLVDRLRDHDNAAEGLIDQSTTLNKKVEAMKQYQEEIEEMNNVARHRPRSALILGIQQENRQIRELQRENRELRVALEEHQSALDLIMSSYREQVCKLVTANNMDKECQNAHETKGKETKAATDKIVEMAAVMQRAIELDEETAFQLEEALARLRVENTGLRELLNISTRTHNRHRVITVERAATMEGDEKTDECTEKEQLLYGNKNHKSDSSGGSVEPCNNNDEAPPSTIELSPTDVVITGDNASSPTSNDETTKIEILGQLSDENKVTDENGSSVDGGSS